MGILLLDFYSLDQKPQSKSKFRNNTKHQTWVRYNFVAREKEKLKKPYQNGKTIDHQQYAQNSGKEARLEN